VTSTPFEPPKRGRRARVLVLEQPGEVLWAAQQHLLRLAPLLLTRDLARLPVVLHLHDLVPGIAARLRAAAIQQEFTA
jgi:hypothetical protein